MALDTFGDLKTYVARARRDTGYEHWTEAQTEDDLNQGILAFCDEVPLERVVVQFVQAADAENAAEYEPDLGVVADEILHLQTGNNLLRRATPAELFTLDTEWRTTTGDPYMFVPAYRPNRPGVVRVYPLPSAVLTDLYGEVTRQHPYLTEDAEVLQLPKPYWMAVAYYALHLGYLADKQETQDLEKSSVWLGRYQDAVKRARRKAERRFDASPQVSYLHR